MRLNGYSRINKAYHTDFFVTCSSYEHMLAVLENGVYMFCIVTNHMTNHVYQLGPTFVRELRNSQEDLNMPQNITDAL